MHYFYCIGLSFSHYNTELQRHKLKGHKEHLHNSGKTGMEPVGDNKKWWLHYVIFHAIRCEWLRAGIITVYCKTASQWHTSIYIQAIQQTFIIHRCLTF